MAARTDDLRDRIAAYAFPRGGVEVVRAKRSYTLYSLSLLSDDGFSRAFDAQVMREKSFQLPSFSGCREHTLA
jgi:hypothetical protein